MVTLGSLWLPILVSAVLVFAASSLVHMALGYHNSDLRQVPAEDEVMAALRRVEIPPGDYVMPRASSMKEMSAPEFVEKMTKGPVVIMTVRPSGPPAMGRSLALWFLFTIAVGILAGYVAGRALPPGAEYLSVFRFAGTTAFAAYAVALWHDSIWYGRAWGTTAKFTFDGLVYALLTGGVFGWLWPTA